jgi:hypothetical protein
MLACRTSASTATVAFPTLALELAPIRVNLIAAHAYLLIASGVLRLLDHFGEAGRPLQRHGAVKGI